MAAKPDTRECPLCGEQMRIRERKVVDQIPGMAESKERKLREWICPECDNFEEVEEEVRR